METKLSNDLKGLLTIAKGDFDIIKKAIQSLIKEWQLLEQGSVKECELINAAMEAYANERSLLKPLSSIELYEFYYWVLNLEGKATKPDRETYLRFADFLKVKLEKTNIAPLKIEYLILYNCPDEYINPLFSEDSFTCKWQNEKGIFAASNVHEAIYSGIEAHFFNVTQSEDVTIPLFDANILPQYYERKKTMYLKEQKNELGILFNLHKATLNFTQLETDRTKAAIEHHKPFVSKGNKKIIAILEGYLNWLESRQLEQSLNNDNFKADFIETYKNEVTPERKEQLKNALSQLRTKEEKIRYIEAEITKYNQSISPEVLFVSGTTSAAFNNNTLLFWDRYLELEKQKIEKGEEYSTNTQKSNHQKTFGVKHYVLTFIFDCHATGKPLPTGSKKEIEEIGGKLMNHRTPNSFYKLYTKIRYKNFDTNSETQLIGLLGDNWRNDILSLSKHPKELEEYLQLKQL